MMDEASDDFAIGFMDGVMSMLSDDVIAWTSMLMVIKESYAIELGGIQVDKEWFSGWKMKT